MWRRVARLVTVGLLLTVLGASAPLDATAATAAAPGLTMTFTPAEVTVEVGVDRAVVLQLTNSTTSAATDVSLTLVPDRGITIGEEPTAPVTLAPGASVALVMAVSRTGDAPASASVQAVLRYVTGSGADAVGGAVVATLDVSEAPAPTAPGAPLTITTSAEAVDLVQYQSTDTFFTVASSSGHTQQVTSAVVSYPTFLTVTAVGPDGTLVEGEDGTLAVEWLDTLGPGDAAIVHLRLDASGPVQPGDGLVLLTVATTDATSGTTATTSASQPITFSVLGESGILTLLGVPSLLFVPGLIFALVLWALWKYAYPRTALASPDVETGGKVVLWVFALLPTLALPFIYPPVTEAVLGQRRDYRRVYGLDDILYVWLLAAVLAVLCWALFWVVVLTVRTVRTSVYLPAPGRSGLRLLSVFAVRLWDRSLSRESYLYKDVQTVVLLRREADTLLVTPPIEYSTKSLDPAEVDKVRDGGLVPGKPFRTWWFFLRRASKAPLTYQVTSDAAAGLVGPTRVAPDTVKAQGTSLSLVLPQA